MAAERPSPRREILLTLSAGALVLLFCWLQVWHDPRFFWHDDFQDAGLPMFFELARGYMHGQWPLLTLNSWIAGCPGGEYQSGVFSLFYSATIVFSVALGLSFPATAAVFSSTHLAFLGMGAFRLGRARGLSADLAMVVAAAAALNGFLITWGAADWVPMLTSFTWLPWAWWALERAWSPRGRPWHSLLAGFFIYLALTGGWPLTDVMLGLATLAAALRAVAQRRSLGPAVPFVAAWAVGLGLAAPALLMFIEYMHHTARGALPWNTLQWEWLVPPAALSGLLLPGLVSTWNEFGRVGPHVPLELMNGLVPAAALAAGLAAPWRRRLLREGAPELALLVLVLALAMLPGLGNFRWSFRWLMLAHLLMGLLGAQAIALWREEARLRSFAPAAWGVGLTLVAWLVASTTPVLSFQYGLLLVALTALWAVLTLRPGVPEPAARWAAALTSLLALTLTYLFVPTTLAVPVWNIPETLRRPAPLQADVRYLGLASGPDYFSKEALSRPWGEVLRPGNTPQFANLQFVNGYSPTPTLGLVYLFQPPAPHGMLTPETSAWLVNQQLGPGGLLAHMGVDGLVLAPSLKRLEVAVLAKGWRRVLEAPDGNVYRRPGPPSARLYAAHEAALVGTPEVALQLLHNPPSRVMPLIVSAEPGEKANIPLTYAPVAATLLFEERMGAAADVKVATGQGPGLLVFARPWFPGMRAWLDGRELRVRLVDLSMPGVELPPGARGRVSLVYRPHSLELGLLIALLTLLLAPLGLLLVRKRAQAAPRGGSAPARPATEAS